MLTAVKNHPHWKSPLKPGHGRGFACGFWFNVGGESTAQVHVNEDGSVTTPPGFKDAYDQFCAAGWPTLR